MYELLHVIYMSILLINSCPFFLFIHPLIIFLLYPVYPLRCAREVLKELLCTNLRHPCPPQHIVSNELVY